MTWCCTTDRWSCPNCWTTRLRGRGITDQGWTKIVRRLQRAHVRACRGAR